MKAIEFITHIQDGIIRVPEEYLKNLQEEFRVIILIEEKVTKKSKAEERRKALSTFKVETKDLTFDRDEANER